MSATFPPHAQRNPEAAWFGFTPVAENEKRARVDALFAKVAPRYDLMNDLMSFGLHRLWKDHLVAHIAPRAGENILDLASGTGDIARRLWRRGCGSARVTLCDYSPAMLQRGRDRAIDAGAWAALDYCVGDAAALPFAARSFDKISIAFGLRNVSRIDDALAECARVLKPGGRFFCMEFSPEVAPLLRRFYEGYSFGVLPRLGAIVAQDAAAYQYLAESIRRFPPPAQLAKRMDAAGFFRSRWHRLCGGIVALHTGWGL